MFTIDRLTGTLADAPVRRTSAAGIPYAELHLTRPGSPLPLDERPVQITVLCWRTLAGPACALTPGQRVTIDCHGSLNPRITDDRVQLVLSAAAVAPTPTEDDPSDDPQPDQAPDTETAYTAPAPEPTAPRPAFSAA